MAHLAPLLERFRAQVVPLAAFQRRGPRQTTGPCVPARCARCGLRLAPMCAVRPHHPPACLARGDGGNAPQPARRDALQQGFSPASTPVIAFRLGGTPRCRMENHSVAGSRASLMPPSTRPAMMQAHRCRKGPGVYPKYDAQPRTGKRPERASDCRRTPWCRRGFSLAPARRRPVKQLLGALGASTGATRPSVYTARADSAAPLRALENSRDPNTIVFPLNSTGQDTAYPHSPQLRFYTL